MIYGQTEEVRLDQSRLRIMYLSREANAITLRTGDIDHLAGIS